jgi:L-lysine exporter family protein LysE/ArgO
VPSSLLAALAGLGLGLSLIVAIGAQNAFVLRQGLRREHVVPVVAVCAVSEVVLVTAGVAGAGAVLDRLPGLTTAVLLGGAAFLLGYAVLAARRALRPASLSAAPGGTRLSLPAALATVLALTWLNPHVYLDTVVLLGTVAQSHGEDRWWFATGALTGSVLWFAALGGGARLLRPLFARPGAWRVLDGAIAVVMVAVAASLLWSPAG